MQNIAGKSWQPAAHYIHVATSHVSIHIQHIPRANKDFTPTALASWRRLISHTKGLLFWKKRHGRPPQRLWGKVPKRHSNLNMSTSIKCSCILNKDNDSRLGVWRIIHVFSDAFFVFVIFWKHTGRFNKHSGKIVCLQMIHVNFLVFFYSPK